MGKLISQIIAGILGFWLAVSFLPGISLSVLSDSSFFGFPLTAGWQIIILLGFILGLINFFLKPILKLITLPLRILTLGAFSLIINMVLIWLIDLFFQEITIPFFWPLLWTTLIIWLLNFALSNLFKKRGLSLK